MSEEQVVTTEVPAGLPKRWYVVHAYSGFEGKVRDAIMAEATRLGLEQLVEQIEVPTETVTAVLTRKSLRRC